MKKIAFIILFISLMPEALAQSVNEGVDIRFENRKKKGYYNTTQISLLMGNRPIKEYNQSNYYSRTELFSSVTMTNGIFNEQWAAGIGVGYEIFDRNLFPVFIDIRHTLRDNDVSPFFAFKMGYAFSGSKKHYDNLMLHHQPYYINNAYYKRGGGFMLHPEMGVKIPLSQKADLLFTVAYRYQKTKSTVSQTHRNWEYKESLNRLSFGIAIMFR
jgi:hypothetical protein